MIYQELTKTMFIDAFRSHNRMDNFTYQGLHTLYDWLDEIGTDYELDVIALCCEFTQGTYGEIKDYYGLKYNCNEEILDYLQDNTIVIYWDDDTALYQSF